MARAFGRILSSIWDDQDFLDLDAEAQRLYMFLVSQPNLNHAGLLPLTVRRWAAKAKRLTAKQLRQSLADLDAAGFLVVDEDTEEVLVRSFVRRDEVYKQPRVMGAAVSGALEISSRRLRRALLAEMYRLPLDELNDEPIKLRNGAVAPSIKEQVTGHIDTLMKAFSEPSGPSSEPPSGGGSPTPSAPPSGSPSETPAEGDPEGDWGTRAHARDPLPLPLPLSPTPVPPSAGRGAPAPGAPLRAVPDEPTAQVILGEYLDRCAKRPPGAVIGQVGKLIKAMLAEGIDPDDVRRGMAAWKAKGLHPASLPSVVNEVMNAGPRTPPRHASNDAFLPGAMARAEALEARMGELTA